MCSTVTFYSQHLITHMLIVRGTRQTGSVASVQSVQDSERLRECGEVILAFASTKRSFSLLNSTCFLREKKNQIFDKGFLRRSVLYNRFAVSRPQSGCHLPNPPWAEIIKLFPSRESLVSDIPAGDGKLANLFYCVPVSHGLQCLLSRWYRNPEPELLNF